MSEMIERVAKVIGGLDNDRCNPCTAEKIVKCEACLEAARVAIEAMREPTQEMLKEAGAETFCSDDYYDPHTTWQKMIDAALTNS